MELIRQTESLNPPGKLDLDSFGMVKPILKIHMICDMHERMGKWLDQFWLWFIELLLAITFASPVHAGLKEGLEAVAAKDYERTYREMLPLAEAGNPNAQLAIGNLYATGRVVAKNDELAAQWYLHAANGGNLAAQTNLAARYRSGSGVPKDYGAALKLYRQAAEQGDDQGLLGLTDMYERGLGVEPDPKIAFRWLKKAAETDYPLAQYSLGVHYWQGRGISRDNDEAYKWILKAANQKYGPAMGTLGMMHLGDGQPLDEVKGCAWLRLAKTIGLKPNDVEQLDRAIEHRCDSLDSTKQREIEERIAQFTPQEIWYERKQREFKELLKKAEEEDVRRQKEGRGK
jgi:TPR repeat protein